MIETAPAPDATVADDASLDQQIARRLKALRAERGWSLEMLAERSGVSRATLSRLENASVSATATILGKLCAAYGLTVSRLMLQAEEDFEPIIRRKDQAVWTDPETGATRQVVSPPARSLAGEAVELRLPAATRVAYEDPPRPGPEHHLVMLEGALAVTANGQRHALKAGDCLRYQPFAASIYETPEGTGARYLLFIV